MTKQQARKRITEMENDYGYSNTWPESYQTEYEALCEFLHGKPTGKKQRKRNHAA